MIEYLKHKSTILSLLSDIIVLTGVFYLSWNPSKVIAFFCLDIEVMIFFFFVFMLLKKEVDLFSFFSGLFLLSIIVYIYLNILLSMKDEFTNTSHKIRATDFTDLFYPFYEVGIFVLITGTGYLNMVFELMKIKNTTTSEIFAMKSVILRMVMVPVTFLIAGYISILFKTNIYTTPFVLFIVSKHTLECWRFKSLKNLLFPSDSTNPV